MAQVTTMQIFRLYADNEGVIHWDAPDGNTYQLNPAKAIPGEWLIVEDREAKPVMAYIAHPGVPHLRGDDSALVLSIEGACSLACTLLHAGDDNANRIYYFATDEHNDNILQRPAFILRASGIEGSPIKPWSTFQILSVR